MNTDTQTDQAIQNAREILSVHLANGRTFYTMTTMGSGQTDYVRVFVAPEPDQIVDVTWAAGKVIGRKFRHGMRGIPLGGGQYNKGLEVVDAISRTLTGDGIDQANWQEIHT